MVGMSLTVSRLASGLPVGGDLEYADEVGRPGLRRPTPSLTLTGCAIVACIEAPIERGERA